MTVKFTKSLNEDIHTIKLEVLNVTSKDMIYFEKKGEPLINIRGTYTQNSNDYSFPNKYRKVYSDQPFTEEFESQTEAEDWMNQMVDVISGVQANINDLNDQFSNEVLVEF